MCRADCDQVARVYWRIVDADAKEFYGKHVGYNGKVFWEADHIHERARNGANQIANMQTLCRVCHQEKTTGFMGSRSTWQQKAVPCKECRAHAQIQTDLKFKLLKSEFRRVELEIPAMITAALDDAYQNGYSAALEAYGLSK